MIGLHRNVVIVFCLATLSFGCEIVVVFMVQTFVFLFLSMLNWKYCFRVTPTCIKGLDGWKPPTSITQQPTSDPQTYSEPLHFQHLGQESVHVIAHGSGGSRQLYIKKKVNTYKHRHTHIYIYMNVYLFIPRNIFQYP